MSTWNIIDSPESIVSLLDASGGFHDSHLVKLWYQSGDYRSGKNSIAYGSPEDHELHMVFHSVWYDFPLELCFNSVRTYHIAGYQKYYETEIFDCHLAFHTDLYAGSDDPLIVWADTCEFSPKTYASENLLHEPMVCYVVADHLKWRFLEISEE